MGLRGRSCRRRGDDTAGMGYPEKQRFKQVSTP
jgi:hypothetical protein